MVQFIDGAMLARMIVHASASLNAEKQKINELNVFPVPDGDTGTNMGLTISAAAAELQKKNPTTVGQTTAVNASAMLRGARGNSGVILSLIFRGFSKAMKDKETMDGIDLADGLNAGVIAAYKAVMKPAEGTVLTVSRMAGDRAGRAAEENTAFEYVLESAILQAEQTLAETTDMNPVLKKAGVVDAGGMGFLVILKGMLDELRGIPMPEGAEAAPAQKEKADFASFETGEITFGYCTEFICSRDNDKDPNDLRAFLDGMGDSLVLVEDDEIIKAHVHTNHPGKVLEEALTYGGLLMVKVENMREQHTELAEGAQTNAPAE
ncbi:MAG: DAK2 domain-containing protein, partial [Ruminiclostridium sp.]|nr:DAK2 domain-containing protein [Ruminiclostridium sp.]